MILHLTPNFSTGDLTTAVTAIVATFSVDRRHDCTAKYSRLTIIILPYEKYAGKSYGVVFNNLIYRQADVQIQELQLAIREWSLLLN
jgi:hypothetical protein